MKLPLLSHGPWHCAFTVCVWQRCWNRPPVSWYQPRGLSKGREGRRVSRTYPSAHTMRPACSVLCTLLGLPLSPLGGSAPGRLLWCPSRHYLGFSFDGCQSSAHLLGPVQNTGKRRPLSGRAHRPCWVQGAQQTGWNSDMLPLPF